ncbi:MurR/RpiR family transcriptional regulator [Fictibacillus phosphorivorans]|uniref:MurR/RpiR family transcriptional regulator n=1 Tax=Fictibacillus phosphorivorans TaxID=1221500 RepID=UPI0020418E83|nr:MurR/RpiR family transcriptional regulator [Fictibacillus phosphorivorans]MCM3718391.1 MurR/RpiR family transcriptional regulator [Fictibacillus phosphorivorans]MCM3776015.1 MurR/RpiR family transcriptional regulator [Fictibacillus phosphorivorans]
MNHQSCILRIKSSYFSFSEKEKQIADYVLNDPKKMVHKSINQVADDLAVADATVFRFCKRLGYKGYQAMRIALAADIVTPIKDIHEQILESDAEIDIAAKVVKSNIRTLEETLNIMNSETLERAVSVLSAARKIDFYGNGGSGVIAMDAHHKFIRTGKTSSAYSDTHMQLMSASQLTDQDAAVFISHSGTNKDLLDVLSVAKDNGAKCIAITNYAKTPLSKQADLVFFTVSEETAYRSEALSSRIAQLTIVDLLFVNFMMKNKDSLQDSIQRMRNAISIKKM